MKGKREKGTSPSTVNINVIGEGTTINGDLSAQGDLRVDGTITGNVQTASKFILGTTGRVAGNIDAANCDVSGKVDGAVRVKELLLIKSTGVVDGDIRTSKMVLENGAQFNGNCTMGNAVPMQKGKSEDHAKQASA